MLGTLLRHSILRCSNQPQCPESELQTERVLEKSDLTYFFRIQNRMGSVSTDLKAVIANVLDLFYRGEVARSSATLCRYVIQNVKTRVSRLEDVELAVADPFEYFVSLATFDIVTNRENLEEFLARSGPLLRGFIREWYINPRRKLTWPVEDKTAGVEDDAMTSAAHLPKTTESCEQLSCIRAVTSPSQPACKVLRRNDADRLPSDRLPPGFEKPGSLLDLPEDILREVHSFISTRDNYRALVTAGIRYGQGMGPLFEKIRKSARLRSADDAVEFFWRMHQRRAVCDVRLAMEEYWGAIGVERFRRSFCPKSNVKVDFCLNRRSELLRRVALSFLDCKDTLLNAIRINQSLHGTFFGISKLCFRALGLLASSRIRKLDLTMIPIADLTPVTRLIKLRILYASDTRVEDVSPLATLANLSELDLSFNPIKEISPLAALLKLRKLLLSETRVVDLTPLSNLVGLEKLCLSFTPVVDIKPLVHLIRLINLDLEQTSVTDVSCLAELDSLKKLNLRDTRADPTPLNHLLGRLAIKM